MKMTSQAAAGITAAQIVQSITGIMGRVKVAMTTGVPANVQQGTPAQTADDIKAALGADNVATLASLIAAYDASQTPA